MNQHLKKDLFAHKNKAPSIHTEQPQACFYVLVIS